MGGTYIKRSGSTEEEVLEQLKAIIKSVYHIPLFPSPIILVNHREKKAKFYKAEFAKTENETIIPEVKLVPDEPPKNFKPEFRANEKAGWTGAVHLGK